MNFFKGSSTFFLLAILLVVSGCEMGLLSTFYSRDILEIGDGNATETLKVNTTFLFEVPTASDKYEKQVLTFVEGALNEPKFVGWEEEGFSTYAKVESMCKVSKLPSDNDFLTANNKSFDLNSSVVHFYVHKTNNEEDGAAKDNYKLILTLNRKKLREVNNKIKQKTFSGVDLNDSQLKFKISNDIREPIIVIPSVDCLINDKPFQVNNSPTVKLESRKEIEIETSKVFSAFLKDKAWNTVFSIQKAN